MKKSQHSAVGCFIEDKTSKSKKGHNPEKKMRYELSPLIVWIAPWIVNTYSELLVNYEISSVFTEILQNVKVSA